MRGRLDLMDQSGNQYQTASLSENKLSSWYLIKIFASNYLLNQLIIFSELLVWKPHACLLSHTELSGTYSRKVCIGWQLRSLNRSAHCSLKRSAEISLEFVCSSVATGQGVSTENTAATNSACLFAWICSFSECFTNVWVAESLHNKPTI